MSRGLLDDSTLELIANRLPDVGKLERIVNPLPPDFISMKFAHTSTVPIAAVCLQDAVNTLTEAKYALHEVYAHRIYYLEKTAKPNEMAAIYFAKFYSDDIALRLYASAEHLANAIVAMLEINREKITKIRKADKKISLASAVGTFLLKQMSDHPISKAIADLIKCDEWGKIMDYRNKWVHEQPPLMEGMGIIWKRKILWEDEGKEVRPGVKARRLTIGGGAKPELTVDNLIQIAEWALNEFVKTTEIVANFYIDLLMKNGIKIEGNKVSLNPFG
jgi:hypothetical protein